MTTTICHLDGMHTSECPHVPCGKCGSTVQVCGGCFACSECHDDYSECSDWLIGMEVRMRIQEGEGK